MTSNRLTRAIAFLCLASGLGCSNRAPEIKTVPEADKIGSPDGGPAVVILLDTSGSMRDRVPDGKGGRRPKHELAHEALEKIVGKIDAWLASQPKKTVYLGMYNFSGSAHQALKMDAFDAARTREAIKKLPRPGGGTAIGSALHTAYQSLLCTRASRQYILCITDGENSEGPDPKVVAKKIHEASGGKVEIYFIAFDVDERLFAYVKEVGGKVVSASKGTELEEELGKVFETKILRAE